MNGLERIKVLSQEIVDKPLLKIVDYLLGRKDMNEKYLNEEKTLKQMIDFIKVEARKEEKNGVAMIEDEVVYGWAIHYWDESNKELGLVKNSKISQKSNKSSIEELTVKIEEKEIPKKEIKKKSKNWVPEGQLSLF